MYSVLNLCSIVLSPDMALCFTVESVTTEQIFYMCSALEHSFLRGYLLETGTNSDQHVIADNISKQDVESSIN